MWVEQKLTHHCFGGHPNAHLQIVAPLEIIELVFLLNSIKIPYIRKNTEKKKEKKKIKSFTWLIIHGGQANQVKFLIFEEIIAKNHFLEKFNLMDSVQTSDPTQIPTLCSNFARKIAIFSIWIEFPWWVLLNYLYQFKFQVISPENYHSYTKDLYLI